MQDLLPQGSRHCFACIQWDGQRTYHPERNIIKVAPASEGTCRIKRSKVKGSSVCDQFFALK
jgi:hypothetical protein